MSMKNGTVCDHQFEFTGENEAEGDRCEPGIGKF